jgi:hypothetical protein
MQPTMTTPAELVAILNKKYPDLFVNAQHDKSITVSGEDGTEAADGFPLFNYWSEDYKEVRYVLGVHKEIGDLLDQHGWWAEWEDAGTINLWQD